MNEGNLSQKIPGKSKLFHREILRYSALIILAFILMIPTYGRGFIGDECMLVLEAKEQTYLSSLTITHAPGYFRPLIGLTFKALQELFNTSAFFYHVFLTMLYIALHNWNL